MWYVCVCIVVVVVVVGVWAWGLNPGFDTRLKFRDTSGRVVQFSGIGWCATPKVSSVKPTCRKDGGRQCHLAVLVMCCLPNRHGRLV